MSPPATYRCSWTRAPGCSERRTRTFRGASSPTPTAMSSAPSSSDHPGPCETSSRTAGPARALRRIASAAEATVIVEPERPVEVNLDRRPVGLGHGHLITIAGDVRGHGTGGPASDGLDGGSLRFR